MSKLKKILKKVLRQPFGALIVIIGWEKFKFISDQMYLKIMFKYCIGTKLNLKKPSTFNEKLQWIKLYDRKPIYTTMVDKIEARKFVSERIGEEYLIPLIGVWDKPEDIDFDTMPDQFVLKCNHNSGTGMCICRNKNQINWENTIHGLRLGLNQNYFYLGREWPYKNVKRRIIGEKYMVDDSGYELKDYKVLCFNGTPKFIELHRGRFTADQTQDYYDIEWNKTSISQNIVSCYKQSDDFAPKPKCLDEMLRLSGMLARGTAMLRVDWYIINNKLYFGELTFFEGSGFDPYDDPEDDKYLGSLIHLPIDEKI